MMLLLWELLFIFENNYNKFGEPSILCILRMKNEHILHNFKKLIKHILGLAQAVNLQIILGLILNNYQVLITPF